MDQPYESPSFRSLAAVPDPEWENEHVRKVESTRRKLERYDRMVGMFQSRGWQDLKEELAHDLQVCVNQLSDHRKQTDPHAIGVIQGQMLHIRRILALPQMTQALRKQERTNLQSLTDVRK